MSYNPTGPVSTVVQTNATVVASGSSIITTSNFANQQVELLINVKNAPTGSTPTIVYSLQEVDAGDGATSVGNFNQSQVINAAGTYAVSLYGTNSNQIKVIWTVTGGTPSFTGVYTTLVTKTTAGTATPMGEIRVATQGSQLFLDAWDSLGLDLVNRWNISGNSMAGAAADQGSNMSLGSGIIANLWSSLTSKQYFKPVSPGWLQMYHNVSIENPVTTNAYRFWGFGTNQNAPTPSAPLYNAVGWEVTTTGVLAAVTYASGTRNLIQDLSSATGNSKQPADSASHNYIILFRGDRIFWSIDGVDNVVASIASGALGPDVNVLPVNFLAIANSTPPSPSAAIQSNAVYIGDTTSSNNTLSDGVLASNRATVKASGTVPVAIDTALVIGLHPSSSPTLEPVAGGQRELNADKDVKGLLEQLVTLVQAQNDNLVVSPTRQFDNLKREIFTMGNPRGMLFTQTTTISASTSETTIVNGLDPGLSYDIYAILVTNTSASTVCRVDIRDTTGGTIRAQIQSVGGTPTNGFSLGGWLLPQLAKGGNWTATCSTSTMDIRITVLYTTNN